MEFKGYVHSEKGYKSSREGQWLIQLQFFKKHKLVVSEDTGRDQ
jgi:hypothetical protein